MSDGPVYTGWLPLQLSGDIEQAKGYEREGRRLLGGLLAAHGVAERIANGEPGGFFKKSVLLADGVRLTAVTNDGHHLVRIDTPRPGAHSEAPHHGAHVESGAQGHTIRPEAEPYLTDFALPTPPRWTRSHEETEEEKKKEGVEYMWVGIRSTQPNIPWYTVNAWMIEPDTGPLFSDSGLPKRGIIASLDQWTKAKLHLISSGDTDYAVAPGDGYYDGTVDEAIEEQYQTWFQGGHVWNGHTHAETYIIRGTHCIEVDDNNNAGVFLISSNGLRCEAPSLYVQNQTDPNRWIGYDPTAKDQTGAGVRDFGDRKTTSTLPVPTGLWDVVYTLDPHEDEGDFPCETRPYMLSARHALERDAGMVTQVLPGEYLLALHAYDTAAQLRSTRAGQTIPLYADDPNGLGVRSATSDYIEYMQPVDSTLDLALDIEVRLGKGESYSVFKFSTVVPSSDDHFYCNAPYGIDWRTQCDPIGGANPFGPNFAPQLLAIDVYGGSARWIDLPRDLAPILGGGVYTNVGDDRIALDVFIFIHPVSQPDQDQFADYAGNALWHVLEAATSRAYGSQRMADPGGPDALTALFAGASKTFVWKYDAQSKTISPLTATGSMDDYTGKTGYQPEMYWYYPLKYQTKDACRHSLGITLTAIRDSWYFENGQVVLAEDPTPRDCCVE